jgi:hypothetical protein
MACLGQQRPAGTPAGPFGRPVGMMLCSPADQTIRAWCRQAGRPGTPRSAAHGNPGT